MSNASTLLCKNISAFSFTPLKQVKLPPVRWALLYDQNLSSSQIPSLKKQVSFAIGIQGGEKAKTFSQLEKTLAQIFKLEEKHGRIDGLVVMGGGSLGDLGAFLASILRRGLRLIHIPTTYLSTIDSAFGGKTALNFANAKNQIGTFWPAEKVYVCRELLPESPKLLNEAQGEVLKMALLSSKLWRAYSKAAASFDCDSFWQLAPHIIKAKLDIVAEDPFERTGLRKFLNLGHTVAHVLEKTSNLPHGVAVAWGLRIEFEFLRSVGELDEQLFSRFDDVWKKAFPALKPPKKVKRTLLLSLLKRDKKSHRDFAQVVSLKTFGEPYLVNVPVKQLAYFVERFLQGKYA